ncbi:hypothetical protein [Arthrobacter sp. S41]|uniref:hypothetical protein n=1 Tax=Arthrobacter sp. S41 TaxID=2509721 RepID=UPI001036483E|nr:hypothetical protein [Arthrobacter sp. S41]TAP27837.1 hypothetical protein EYR88_05805 [Arthrobacter sp. S41]
MSSITNGSASRLMNHARAASRLDTVGIVGLIDAANPLKDQLNNMKSLVADSLKVVHWSPYENVLNTRPSSLQVLGQGLGMVAAEEILSETMSSQSIIATPKLRTIGTGLSSWQSVRLSSVVDEISAFASQTNADPLGLGKLVNVETNGASSAVLAGQRDVLKDIIENAEEFDRQCRGTEIEATANDFLDSHAHVAVQLANSSYLVTLTFKQRRQIARYLAVVVYLSFVSIAVYGVVASPILLQVLALFGVTLGHKTAATTTYKYSMKVLDSYLADPEEG